MRQDVVVEILPDGTAALRLVILPDEVKPEQKPEHPESERGVVEIPMWESDEDTHVVVWEM